MSRHPQGTATKGSKRWLQVLINQRPQEIDQQILATAGARAVDWRSPLEADEFAEYQDEDAFALLGLRLTTPLYDFWPRGGPQWDGLAVLDDGGVVLVEAKSHIGELFSAGSQARPESMAQIRQALIETQAFLGAETALDWAGPLYQYCNRVAHLYFLRERCGIPAWLVNCYFVGDEEMNGPNSAAEWSSALHVTQRLLGLRQHRLSRYVIDLYIPVWALGQQLERGGSLPYH